MLASITTLLTTPNQAGLWGDALVPFLVPFGPLGNKF